MNSLSILSSRVSPPASPAPSRTNSLGSLNVKVTDDGDVKPLDEEDEKRAGDADATDEATADTPIPASASDSDSYLHIAPSPSPCPSEDTPLLSLDNKDSMGVRASPSHLLPRSIATSFINSIRWVLSTLAAPGVYLIACLYTEDGEFSPLYQLRRLFAPNRRNVPKINVNKLEKEMGEKPSRGHTSGSRLRAYGGTGSSSSGLSSESESDMGRHTRKNSHAASSRHSRSKSLEDSADESLPTRRSIRIKLNDESGKRSHRKSQSSASARASRASNPKPTSAPTGTDGASETNTKDISAQLKSPTSPVAALTRYPKTPAPPRPLIPRRQPSYINMEPTDKAHQKTLIIDLDETLIHSMSKGGRMSTGHMVEVRLQQPVQTGSTTLEPQHPILYYVHKRPHCDDFLRRVCKWYNLVVFTASVQEYADPVIDWLESERKFFSGRFYRQHCTFRHGAFIKDLAFVEPDLSKVMILDNSPLSYMFHQDNAIPIQGWINDPTDNDLLHLVPFLEGLQYVSDVRALLALRGGEDGQHMGYN